MLHEKRIAAWGLSSDEIHAVKKVLPARDIDVAEVSCATDLIAINWLAILVQADAMTEDDRDLLYWFYQEAGDVSEAVLFFGNVDVPPELRRVIKIYPSFQAVDENLKYILLTAYRRKKNSENFSISLARAVRVLVDIRAHPGVTTAVLAEKLEVSPRSIQRCIETLRVAGEWIEYDSAHRG